MRFRKQLIAQATAFCAEREVDIERIKAAQGFEKIALLDEAVEALIESDDTKKAFMGLARAIARVFRAILPDPSANEVTPDAVLFSVLAQKIMALTPPADISHIMAQVEELLDRSVAPVPYILPKEPPEHPVDLSKIDFDKLREKFDQGKKRTEAERLRALLNQKLQGMVSRNQTRKDFLERFQQLIATYNAGSQNIEAFFAELIKLAQDLTEEEQRAMREGLTEEELALFDILTKPEPDLSDKEKGLVKKTCKTLLDTLKAEKLVLDWRLKPQARGAVRQAIEAFLDDGLPEAYDEPLFNAKCDAAYLHVYDCYYGAGQSLYAPNA